MTDRPPGLTGRRRSRPKGRSAAPASSRSNPAVAARAGSLVRSLTALVVTAAAALSLLEVVVGADPLRVVDDAFWMVGVPTGPSVVAGLALLVPGAALRTGKRAGWSALAVLLGLSAVAAFVVGGPGIERVVVPLAWIAVLVAGRSAFAGGSGDEAVVDLARLLHTGGRSGRVRCAVRRPSAEGYRTTVRRIRDVPGSRARRDRRARGPVAARLRRAGPIDGLRPHGGPGRPRQLLVEAFAPDGSPCDLLTFAPRVATDEQLDVMRRSADAPAGIVEQATRRVRVAEIRWTHRGDRPDGERHGRADEHWRRRWLRGVVGR